MLYLQRVSLSACLQSNTWEVFISLRRVLLQDPRLETVSSPILLPQSSQLVPFGLTQRLTSSDLTYLVHRDPGCS